MIPIEKNKANADPTKSFFVRMITRDITLEDCIFDLIDNSIDGAWELSGGQPMGLNDKTDLSPYRISIEIEKDRFVIRDNCGGITLDDAVDYAFTFGRKDDAETENFSIGAYGIGMKRAVFKLGAKIDIRSTFKEMGTLSSFQVPIDVDAWLGSSEDEWDFDIKVSDDLPDAGVQVEVEQLTDVAARSFESPGFIQNLRRAISRDYALHLHRGLTIEVQGKAIPGWAIELRQGGDFTPMRTELIERIQDEKIYVELLAGMLAPPDSSESIEDFDENFNRSGWYVVCNGRIVLAADKTVLTGWGTEGSPQWHPQYTGFMGIILFSSRRADLLPLTTTKRNVDETSAIYRQFRAKMRETTKEWISYTNVRKQVRIKALEKEGVARAVPIFEIPNRPEVMLPQMVAVPKVSEANVFYSISKPRLRSLASAFGDINMSYKDVGLQSFEFAYSDLIGEE